MGDAAFRKTATIAHALVNRPKTRRGSEKIIACRFTSVAYFSMELAERKRAHLLRGLGNVPAIK